MFEQIAVTSGLCDGAWPLLISAGGRPVVYGQGRSTIFRMPIYPMLNQWNANPMTPNPGL